VLELVQRALRPVDDVLEVVEPDLHALEVGPPSSAASSALSVSVSCGRPSGTASASSTPATVACTPTRA
jgi:hypothetical protein